MPAGLGYLTVLYLRTLCGASLRYGVAIRMMMLYLTYSTEVLEYAALRGHGDHEKKKPYYAALFHAV